MHERTLRMVSLREMLYRIDPQALGMGEMNMITVIEGAGEGPSGADTQRRRPRCLIVTPGFSSGISQSYHGRISLFSGRLFPAAPGHRHNAACEKRQEPHISVIHHVKSLF